MNNLFHRFAHWASVKLGTPWAFVAALLVVLIWAILGPLFHFSNTWQLVINTGTTIVTFLMVFLIQNTQNRDSTAVHLKLDELVKAMQGARNKFIDVEDLSEEELKELAAEFQRITRRKQAAKQEE